MLGTRPFTTHLTVDAGITKRLITPLNRLKSKTFINKDNAGNKRQLWFEHSRDFKGGFTHRKNRHHGHIDEVVPRQRAG